MHQPFIIQHLFQVSSLEDVSRERLEAFVETYPSYGIGHYLLSCKLQAEGSERFVPETQRTCLYFSNPLWLQWQLQNSDGTAAAQPAETPAAWVAEPVTPETPVSTIGEWNAPVEEQPTTFEAQHAIIEAEHITFEEQSTTPVIDEPNPETTVENVVTMAEETLVSAASEAEPEVESGAEESSAAEQLLRSIEEARGLRESVQKFNEDFTVETGIAGESLPDESQPAAEEPVAEEPAQPYEEPVTREIAPQEEPIHDEEAPFVLDETEERPAVTAETAPAEASTPAPTATQDFLFEPYHTIDYFASQGIKLTLDENPQDKLGKQLKSFTEWLKTMRRLPQKDREVVPDRVMEEAIQTSAAHSIQGKDIVTETMAEVLAMQGMREKARAVYEKLSLLNPDKRAYFAAKIEQLNIP